jgi:protein-disulfide isomerase
MALDPPFDPQRDHVRAGGAPDAVTLVEYGDFECPYCGDAFRAIEQVRARMGERLAFAFLAGRVHVPRIDADVESGVSSGVTGTPGLFIAGERYTGFYDVESLHEALEDAAATAFARRPRR